MDDQPATVVAFPLRGEWTAVNTPAERVPSHGTDQLGQRFAFDFLRIDWASEGFRFHAQSTLRYAVVGVPLDARCGSVRAAAGDRGTRGQHVADVGHSGNSTAPHLHFQLMDGPDLRTAQGLPCAFAEYDVHDGNAWQRVNDQVPGKRQRLRFAG
jgi:hypothetical protein